MQHTGSLIKIHREKLGLSQSEVATKCGYISAQFISNIERGKASLPIEKAGIISRLLKIKPNVILEAKVLDVKESLKKGLKDGSKKKRVSRL